MNTTAVIAKEEGEKFFVVVGEKKHKKYDRVENFIFAPDGTAVYHAIDTLRLRKSWETSQALYNFS